MSIWLFFVLALLLIFVLAWVLWPRRSQPSIQIEKPYRPIVMIVVDSLVDEPLQEAIQMGKAPLFAYLQKKGYYEPHLISCFPTMSVSIDTTLLTGTLPREHKIYGLTYFHSVKQRLINLGTGALESLHFGLHQVLSDGLCKLNQELISSNVKTIHEEAPVATGSLNAMIYRGDHPYLLTIPQLLRRIARLPEKVLTRGPKLFSLGALRKLNPYSRHAQPWFRYGENDRFVIDEFMAIATKNELPPFTILYMPDNDDQLHQKGRQTVKGIIQANQELERVFNAFPSWEEAIRQVSWIVLGDSGQTNLLANRKEAYLDLKQMIPLRIMPTKQQKPTPQDQAVLCVNERMSILYLLDPELTYQQVVLMLKEHPYFDVIAWWEGEECHVASSQKEGLLSFAPSGEYHDEYQQSWQLTGDPSLLDLRLKGQRIEYGQYPDALNRLMGNYEAKARKIIFTCLPGYEMIFEASPTHKGAAHGSLHQLDTYVPLIVTGLSSRPAHPRIQDLKAWILEELKEA